jgi:uncharacterized protein DUF2513
MRPSWRWSAENDYDVNRRSRTVKRDMDLCREILLRAEESPDSAGPTIKIDGRSSEEISYHIKLLSEAGLAEVGAADGQFTYKKSDGSILSKGQKVYSVMSLTWQGHEFLDAARNDTIWRKVKNKVVKATGGLVFDVLKAALLAEIGQQLGT